MGYPLPGMDQITGSIFGRVTMEGAPVFGAFVVAVDAVLEEAAQLGLFRLGQFRE